MCIVFSIIQGTAFIFHIESINALNYWKLKRFKIIDEHVLSYLDLLPPKPKLYFRYLKQGHRKYVLAPADKAANNVVVV